MKRLIQLVLVALLLVPLMVGAQTTHIDYLLRWAAPTTGNPVAQYVVLVSVDHGTFETYGLSDTNQLPVSLPVGYTYIFAVFGVDSTGRNGLTSDHSEEYFIDAGAPGACGIPWLE